MGIGVVVRGIFRACLAEMVLTMVIGVGSPILILRGTVPSEGDPGLCEAEKGELCNICPSVSASFLCRRCDYFPQLLPL